MNARHLFVFSLLLLGLFYAQVAVGQTSWSTLLPTIGTFSSPRVTDLNRDGVQDIILGAGRLEFQRCDSAIIALDGKTGKLLWNRSANDQIFGSAALKDINADQIDDVFINGRSSELQAIDGATGRVIWKFDTLNYPGKSWFNFYNPQFIHDVDHDGIDDLLLANGGDIIVPPHNPNRRAGRLVVISTRTGKLLASATMPDGKEIYMSVVVNKDSLHPERSPILFGTGGETIGGNLFVGTIGMLLQGDLSSAEQLASCATKGFIAPPAWADLTNDGIKDIVVNSVDGRVMAFDGKTHRSLWSTQLLYTEAYSSMAIGYFNRDPVPDVFVSFAQGTWPDLTWTKQAMVNGINGQIEFSDSLGFYQTSSPVVADVTEDGVDEVILSVDYQLIDSLGFKSFSNTLMVIQFDKHMVVPLLEGLPGHNVSSTPWVGDLDKDGFLDIVFCNGTNPRKTYTFDGMRVNKIGTTIPLSRRHQWGAYMGSHYDGVFRSP
ncbi:outer membrane protein assembly factor BamB family protein [Spirosoma validum]|uniref:PQQ-binding-like beta-propeller repeat protein n=1 Tax=Spirosoma validum TaxID=2771355 RepID=A0A927AZF5_9BACT|nr:PQQ-binding-like beta-propeller repeat protein [Spirosoma validum]MBD2752706.1 PQQ-binding-like beta-propeller repeat protein [Spirosoma validum]